MRLLTTRRFSTLALTVLMGAACATPARAQIFIPPETNDAAFDEGTSRYLKELNSSKLFEPVGPYSRDFVPVESLRRTPGSSPEPGPVTRVIQDDRVWVVPPSSATRDSSLQDGSAFNPSSPEDNSVVLSRPGEPPRAAAPSGTFSTVGYGQLATGGNFRALIATRRIVPGTPTTGSTIVPQVVTGFPTNANNMFLTGVSANGTVAAGYYGTLNPSTTVAFALNVSTGAITTLPLAAGDLRATPSKLTPDGGFIVGTSYQTSTDPTVANDNNRIIRWTRSGTGYTAATIGGFPGAFRTIANSISADGTAIVGTYFDATRNTRPFRWTQAGGFQDLGSLPGQLTGQAIGLNNDGSVVVGSGGQAFIWTAADGMKPLRSLTGSGFSTANAITPNGSFIGGASYDGNFVNGIALLWTKDGETIKLRDLLVISGVDVTGWVFNSVDRIVRSSDGTYTIMGNGTRNGVGTGFIFFWKRAAGPPPAITTQPQAQAAAAGGSAVLSVVATGATAYQWQRNGTAITGATNATLTLANPQAANAGSYTVVVSNGESSVTSTAAALTVAPTISRLTNVSVRTTAGTGANILIVGFTLGGGGKNVLLRAVGPTLGTFGVPGTLDDPRLALFNAASAQTHQNDDWGGGAALTSAFDAVGAFRLPAASKDAVLLNYLAAGGYTAQVSGAAGTSGVVLLEAYDSDAGSPLARYTNLSARNQVGTGGNILIVGFNITGNGPKNLLIRAVGPGLAQFGVTGTLADPQLAIFNSSGTQTNQNDDWGGGAALAATFTSVGAFNLPAASKDAALSITLQPGSYTAQVSGIANSTGVALAEIYELP